MRALRSRKVQSDSGNNLSDAEKALKKEKRNKKSKKTSKRKTDISLQSQSTDSDVFTKSSEPKKHIKTSNISKSKQASRNSTLKENISPNIKEVDVFEKSPQHPKKSKKKTRRNEKHTSSESLEFNNVVTSTAIKPKKTRNSNIRDSPKNISGEQQPQGIVSRNLSMERNGTIDVTETKNKSRTTRSKKRSTFEVTRNSQEYSPTFKNVVTSTTIKQKKLKPNPKKEKKLISLRKASKELIDENDNASSNILLENDIINISDNTNKHENVLNSTYLKIDDECCSQIVTTNNSGEWKIEDHIINVSDEINMFESNLNNEVFTSPVETNKDTKKVLFQDKSLNKNARKKWQCYPRNSQGANSILEQISTPQKKSPPNKSINISQKINKTANTSTQSTHKIKRTAMPNFALIHKKAYEKMESISEYSQRKKDRANLLQSNKKVQLKENETTGTVNKIKSSRQLFTKEKPADTSKNKFNRFGFKVKSPSTNTTNKPPMKPLNSLKPSIYDRGEILTIANKKPQYTGKVRENKRDLLKGVRTNRRFELLMKMRNN